MSWPLCQWLHWCKDLSAANGNHAHGCILDRVITFLKVFCPETMNMFSANTSWQCFNDSNVLLDIYLTIIN